MPRDWSDVFITAGAAAPTAGHEEPEQRRGFFRRLRQNLSKTREALGAELQATLFSGDLDEETWERLEEALIMADVGASTTAKVVARLEQEADAGGLEGGEALSGRLVELLAGIARTQDEAAARIDLTPEPTVSANLAIISGVKVVGQSAAYSPDGAWFAFTARPTDGSEGPDIYVWRVGDQVANVVTSDHASVFASWAGDRLIGSRVATDATGITTRSFFIDPDSGDQSPIDGSVWRPAVDPDEHWAVTWDGTVTVGQDNKTPVVGDGSLVLRGFSDAHGVDTTGKPAAVVAKGPFAEFDVRWDETGSWLAVWVADGSDPSIGRLSLLQLDPVTGELDRPHGAPRDMPALPGFSIANGRLAWATPPGQGGEGSRVQVVAWTDDSVGAVESGPVENVVVIH